MPPTAPAKAHSLRRDALTLFILCVTVYLAFAKGRPWVEATLQTERARLLVEQHTLSSAAPVGSIDILAPDGRYYDVHGLLNTVIHVPVVAFDRLLPGAGAERRLKSDFIASFSGVVINSLTVAVFYLLVRTLAMGRGASLTAAAALAFGTMLFPYAGTNYEGNADVLCLVLAAYYCFRFLRDPGDARARHLAWCGLWCGVALLGRESNFPFVGLVGIAVLHDAWKTKQVTPMVWFVAAMLPFALLLGWYNLVRTGTPFETAIMHDIRVGRYPNFTAGHPFGIVALLASPGGSIFIYSPMALLALLGIRESFRRFRLEASIAAVFVLATLVSTGLRASWFGLASWGPRYMTPALPFLLIALAAWLDRNEDAIRQARRRALVSVFLAGAIAIQLVGALVNWQSRLWLLIGLPKSGDGAFSSPMMSTTRHSQWWDAITTLGANVRYMATGQASAGMLSGLPPVMSPSSRYTSMTLDTWWNRLMFDGLPPIVVVVYLIASAAIIAFCVNQLLTPRWGLSSTPAGPARRPREDRPRP